MDIMYYVLSIKYYIYFDYKYNDGTRVERQEIAFSSVKCTGNLSHT